MSVDLQVESDRLRAQHRFLREVVTVDLLGAVGAAEGVETVETPASNADEPAIVSAAEFAEVVESMRGPTISVNAARGAPKAKNDTTRVPLGRRDRSDVNHTVLRVVGKESKTPVLDVAAFQSFVE